MKGGDMIVSESDIMLVTGANGFTGLGLLGSSLIMDSGKCVVL